MAQLKDILESIGLISFIALSTLGLYFLPLFIKTLKSKKDPPTIGTPNNADKHRVIGEDLRTHVHEAGHIITAWLNPYVTKVEGAIIFRNGQGVTWMRALNVSKPSHAWHRLTIDLAGIAAEINIYKRTNPLSSADDLRNALHTAQSVITTNPEALKAPPWLDTGIPGQGGKSLGTVFQSRPSEEVTLFIDKAYSHTKSLIASRSDKLRQLVFALEAGHGHLCTQEIEAIMGPRPAHAK